MPKKRKLVVAKRKRGGRAVGSRNRVTIQREILAGKGLSAALDAGETPLDVMLHRMRGTRAVSDEQFNAAVAVAPYVHPKLSAIARVDVPESGAEFDFSGFTNAELATFRHLMTLAKGGARMIEGAVAEADR
jgi:hypothetical protein